MGMVAVNADKTKVVDVDSVEAAFMVNEEDLEKFLAKPPETEAEADAPVAAPVAAKGKSK
jgi:hypothetical protein